MGGGRRDYYRGLPLPVASLSRCAGRGVILIPRRPDKLDSIKLCRQELDRVHRVDPGQAVNLAATGEAGGDEAGLRVGGRGVKQHTVGQGDADVVVAMLIAKRAGHAAAAGIELVDLQAGNVLQGGQRTGGPDRGLLLAVAVQQDAPVQRPELQGWSPGEVGHEGIDEHAVSGEFEGERKKGCQAEEKRRCCTPDNFSWPVPTLYPDPVTDTLSWPARG